MQTALKDGPQPVEQVKSHATALSITAATLRRARERIGVMHRQIKGEAHGGWEYCCHPMARQESSTISSKKKPLAHEKSLAKNNEQLSPLVTRSSRVTRSSQTL